MPLGRLPGKSNYLVNTVGASHVVWRGGACIDGKGGPIEHTAHAKALKQEKTAHFGIKRNNLARGRVGNSRLEK